MLQEVPLASPLSPAVNIRYLCRDVKQYHVEGDEPVGSVELLGVHDPSQDSWGASDKTYQPQWYGNGSR